MSAVSVWGSRHHHILRLQQTSHHIKHSCLANGCLFVLRRQWRVARHEEMQSRCRDERCDESDEIVVHVAWVPEGRNIGSLLSSTKISDTHLRVAVDADMMVETSELI